MLQVKETPNEEKEIITSLLTNNDADGSSSTPEDINSDKKLAFQPNFVEAADTAWPDLAQKSTTESSVADALKAVIDN